MLSWRDEQGPRELGKCYATTRPVRGRHARAQLLLTDLVHAIAFNQNVSCRAAAATRSEEPGHAAMAECATPSMALSAGARSRCARATKNGGCLPTAPMLHQRHQLQCLCA